MFCCSVGLLKTWEEDYNTAKKRHKPLRQYIKVYKYIMEVHKISKDCKANLPKRKWDSLVTWMRHSEIWKQTKNSHSHRFSSADMHLCFEAKISWGSDNIKRLGCNADVEKVGDGWWCHLEPNCAWLQADIEQQHEVPAHSSTRPITSRAQLLKHPETN